MKYTSPSALLCAESPRMLTRGSTIICSEDIEKVALCNLGKGVRTIAAENIVDDAVASRKPCRKTAPIKSKIQKCMWQFYLHP